MDKSVERLFKLKTSLGSLLEDLMYTKEPVFPMDGNLDAEFFSNLEKYLYIKKRLNDVVIKIIKLEFSLYGCMSATMVRATQYIYDKKNLGGK